MDQHAGHDVACAEKSQGQRHRGGEQRADKGHREGLENALAEIEEPAVGRRRKHEAEQPAELAQALHQAREVGESRMPERQDRGAGQRQPGGARP